jgi:hypothetical protein
MMPGDTIYFKGDMWKAITVEDVGLNEYNLALLKDGVIERVRMRWATEGSTWVLYPRVVPMPSPNMDATRDFLERCFKYNTRVIIEDCNVYAWPSCDELRKQKIIKDWEGPPVWDLLRAVGNKYSPGKYSIMSVGNGGCCRGDQASYDNRRITFAQGVFYPSDLEEWDDISEAILAKGVERALLGSNLGEAPYCMHGGKARCTKDCFVDWGVYCRKPAVP